MESLQVPDAVECFKRLERSRAAFAKPVDLKNAPLAANIAFMLSEHIEERRREIVATVLRSPASSPRLETISANVFVNTLLDGLASELQSGDRDSVESWLDDAHAGSRVDAQGLATLTCSMLAASFVSYNGPSDDVVRYLSLRGTELSKRIELARAALAGRTPVDPSTLVSKDEVVDSMLSVLETYDPALAKHARAVGAWSARLAKTLGLGSETQAFAELCGTLLDIGNVVVPREILSKPAPLTEHERTLVRSHGRVGASMLERIPSLMAAAPIVRWHHERVDGTGYPDGLRGEDIPIVGRIVAVADAFHAMISKRPHRDALPVGRAVEALLAGRGTQWDPLVVDAMLSTIGHTATKPALRAVEGGARG